MANDNWDDNLAKAFNALMRFLTSLTKPPALYVVAGCAVVWAISSGYVEDGVVNNLIGGVVNIINSLKPVP